MQGNCQSQVLPATGFSRDLILDSVVVVDCLLMGFQLRLLRTRCVRPSSVSPPTSQPPAQHSCSLSSMHPARHWTTPSSLLQPVHVCSRFRLCLYRNGVSPLPLMYMPNLCLILPPSSVGTSVCDCLLSPRQSQSLPVPAMPRANFLMSLYVTLSGRSGILWTAPRWTIYCTYTQQLFVEIEEGKCNKCAHHQYRLCYFASSNTSHALHTLRSYSYLKI